MKSTVSEIEGKNNSRKFLAITTFHWLNVTIIADIFCRGIMLTKKNHRDHVLHLFPTAPTVHPLMHMS